MQNRPVTFVRTPIAAGTFYPEDPDELRQTVQDLLAEAEAASGETSLPKAMIVPHAGYSYSGPIAATAYARLKRGRDRIRRVVLLGPAHRVMFRGLAASSAECFATPLGHLYVDREAIDTALQLESVQVLDEAHLPEHSLEVHIPFLQETLGDVTIAPFLVGNAEIKEIVELLELLWGGEETLIIVSSDLSHYHDYETCRRLDEETSEAIVSARPELLRPEGACGYRAIAALITQATRHNLGPRLIDLRNSGDTSSHRDRVVGYGAYIFEPAA